MLISIYTYGSNMKEIVESKITYKCGSKVQGVIQYY